MDEWITLGDVLFVEKTIQNEDIITYDELFEKYKEYKNDRR